MSATKRKTKTEVTYEVEDRDVGESMWLSWSLDHKTLKDALDAARQCAVRTRIVRVERTVVAEVKP